MTYATKLQEVMMRLALQVLALSVLLAPASLADEPARTLSKEPERTGSGVIVKSSPPTTTGEVAPAPLARMVVAAPQGPRGVGAEPESPPWLPVPATSGTLGLFTVETAQNLPRRAYSFSTYVNKFSRAPGSVTILNFGWNIGVGLRDWFTFYAGFEPYRFTRSAIQSQLSLNTPSGDPTSFPPFPPTIYRSLGPGLRPGYVEDYPFLSCGDDGVGEVTAGFKLAFLSETQGDPFSFSVRNDFILPTRTGMRRVLGNGTQSGQVNYAFTVAFSRTFGRTALVAGNWGYRFTRDPRFNPPAMTQADQFRVGAGFLLFPESRVQFMNEYTGLLFFGSATPNTTFGARDPVDGVWGVRWYLWRNVALDLGYRYMLNLRAVQDRHGFVAKLALVHWPGKPPRVNRSPVASCSTDQGYVYAGSDDFVTVRVQASDPDNDALTYSWSANGGRVEGNGAEVRWSAAGAAPGTYTITARVNDGRGGTASCAVDVRVEPRPNRAPTMTCSVERGRALVGERVRIMAVANDPDGDALTYTWRTNGGQILGSGASVDLDTSGLSPGRYTVTARVEDGRGGAADCSASVDVQAPPPPPQASKLNQCYFNRAGGARVDNVCKRILDDVALRLKSEPRATVVMVGYADPKEPKPEKLAKERADNAAKYLASKEIDPGRIMVRAAGGQAGADQANRRIDIIWVPEGATY